MKNYYLLNNGRLRRQDFSLVIETPEGQKKHVPVEDVDSVYLYGEVDLNTKALVFLASRKIPLHVFNYYGFYSGSYYPREYLHSGYLLVNQVGHYSDPSKRLALASELVRGSAHSLTRNVAYYSNRRSTPDREPAGEIEPLSDEPSPVATDFETEAAVDSGLSLAPDAESEPDPFESSFDFDTSGTTLEYVRTSIATLASNIVSMGSVPELMGLEGKMRVQYYRAWPHILSAEWAFEKRVRRPPDNEVNALISFGNSVLYTVCLSELYRTQLTPTISYLHEPGARRFSLALDLSEIFKPLIVDRGIFRLLNTGQLKSEHFERSLDGCYLNKTGQRLFLGALEERMNTTIRHRRLGRHVTYRHLIRLECYKLIRHLTDVEPYRAFRAWW